MSRPPRRCLSLLALAVILGGCGDAGLRTERPPRVESSAVIWACDQQPVVRPRSLVIACADGNTALADLRWRDWGAETATADGRMVANPCTPDCAASRQVSWPVHVTVRDLVIGAHHAAYASVAMTATGRHPHGTLRHYADSLPINNAKGRS